MKLWDGPKRRFKKNKRLTWCSWKSLSFHFGGNPVALTSFVHSNMRVSGYSSPLIPQARVLTQSVGWGVNFADLDPMSRVKMSPPPQKKSCRQDPTPLPSSSSSSSSTKRWYLCVDRSADELLLLRTSRVSVREKFFRKEEWASFSPGDTPQLMLKLVRMVRSCWPPERTVPLPAQEGAGGPAVTRRFLGLIRFSPCDKYNKIRRSLLPLWCNGKFKNLGLIHVTNLHPSPLNFIGSPCCKNYNALAARS